MVHDHFLAELRRSTYRLDIGLPLDICRPILNRIWDTVMAVVERNVWLARVGEQR